MINVGSTNPAKVEAVKEVLSEYELFNDVEVKGTSVDSGVSDQPKSLDETIKGAINRAQGAWNRQTTISLGLESGIFPVPYTKSGYMDVCVCAIYDGKSIALGMSEALEFPRELTKMIIEKKVNANEAARLTGLTSKKEVGSDEGIVGIVTKGRVSRKDYTKSAIRMALVHLEHPDLY